VAFRLRNNYGGGDGDLARIVDPSIEIDRSHPLGKIKQ
jgi:hypothetical protein